MRIRRFVAALAAGLAITSLVAPERGQAQQKYITVGTGGAVGVYHALGGAICRFVNADRREHNVRCSAEPSSGSVSNIQAVMDGKLDVGFAQSDTQFDAMHGTGAFKDKPQPNLRALFSVYPEVFTLVVRQDANIGKFEDVRGKRVGIGEPGSGTRATMELVMQEFGIARSDLKRAAELKFAEMAPALCANRIDAFVFVAGHPNPIFREAATTCASSIVAVTGPPIDRLVAAHPFYAKAYVPGNLYKGTDTAQPAFGVLATLVVSADMPDATAYAITKSVFDALDDFKQVHPAIARMTVESSLEGHTVPFHPGAAKYFREKGFLQ